MISNFEPIPTFVNSGVDTILRLVPLSAFEPRERHHHRIRIIQVNERCEVLDCLKAWAKSSPTEYKRVLNGLNRIAENEDLPRLKTIKRVGPLKRIIQIAGSNARLYAFEDSDNSYTIVCVNTFWIGKGNKLAQQNEAIRRAETMMIRWQQASPLAGYPDTRIEKRREGK